MPFHHVLLALQSESTKPHSIFVDLSEEELRVQFLKPYAKGQDIISGNEVIPVSQIRKLHIVRTARRSEIERGDLLERSLKEMEDFNNQSNFVVLISPGRGYDPEDILEVGEDVTTHFISGPPGHASVPSPVVGLLSNQWVVAVGTGLLVAVLVWWFGWN